MRGAGRVFHYYMNNTSPGTWLACKVESSKNNPYWSGTDRCLGFWGTLCVHTIRNPTSSLSRDGCRLDASDPQDTWCVRTRRTRKAAHIVVTLLIRGRAWDSTRYHHRAARVPCTSFRRDIPYPPPTPEHPAPRRAANAAVKVLDGRCARVIAHSIGYTAQ